MALDKVVDSAQLNADLTTVANAIREKGGTSEQFSFPSGMVQAIADIPTGGSDIDIEPLSVTENGTYTAPSGKAYSPISVNVSGGGGGISNGIVYDSLNDLGYPKSAIIYGGLLMPYSFYMTPYCGALEKIVIKDSIVNSNATILSSTGMNNLSEIYFESTPQSLNNKVFDTRKTGLTIYVPWSSGAVAGAPWGAVNATIVYNYTGE